MLQKSSKPLLIFGTRHSTLYNLTPVNQPSSEYLQAIQLSYGDIHDNIQTFESLPKGMTVKKFLNYPEESLLYLTPYDFSKNDCMNGCQNNSFVKIKCNKGYTLINAAQYDKVVQLISPDMFVGLTQYPYLQKDHKQCSNKSYKRAICKTKSYLQKSKLIGKNQQSTLANQPAKNDEKVQCKAERFAAVHGGINLSLVARSLQQVLDHQFQGIVVCDLCQQQTIEQRQQVFDLINKRLQMQYKRQASFYYNKKIKMILAGLGKIQDIQHALKHKFQVFQVHQPFLVAQQQKALLWQQGKVVIKQPVKHQNLQPLDKNCTCKTCKNYSQAYIAHLVQCYELNAKILLSTHNLHIYTEWLNKFDINHQ